MNITVKPVNDITTISGDTNASLTEDSKTFAGTLTLGDIDKLKEVIVIDQALHGTATITDDSVSGETNDTIKFTYIPSDDFNGEDKFNIAVIDELGSATIQAINLTIKSAEDEAIGWTITELTTAKEDTTITGIVYATDVDGALKYSINVQPENGTVEMLNQDTGIWQYEPNTDYHGSDSFTIRATDANGGTSDHEYNFTVEEGNDPTIITSGLSSRRRKVVSRNPAKSDPPYK